MRANADEHRIEACDRLDVALLYRRHRASAFAIARAFLKDDDDALDAVQEAFSKVHRCAAQFDGRSSPQTWLHRIVVNVCRDLRRRRGRRPEIHVEDVEEIEPCPCSLDQPDRSMADLELRRLLVDALQRLSARHRTVVVLRELSGLDYRRIAEHEGCPKGTVMSRLFHARQQLRRWIDPRLALERAPAARPSVALLRAANPVVDARPGMR